MIQRLLHIGVAAVFGWIPVGAMADEGAAPSGPEACVVDEVNARRAASSLRWSGVVRTRLSHHAASMADRGELDHAAMSDRVAALPDGWSAYGEATFVGRLQGMDAAAAERWCRDAVDGFWGSPSHREILEDGTYDFISVGTHWDGENLWVGVGVFAHPDHRPAPVQWPRSYAHGLKGDWEGRFSDDDGLVFEPDIEQVAAAELTQGCNPPLDTHFCPSVSVTRGEMAAFLVRAFGWSSTRRDHFVDDDNSVFEQDIEALVAAGVTEGCNPPAGDRFCPNQGVTRAEMASFLGRALGLDPAPGSRFADTSGSVHQEYINAVAEAGISAGCDATGTRYCPDRSLTRAEMAAFLVRAGLAD